MTALNDFRCACADALLEHHLPALNYAVGYLKAGLSLDTGEECRVQALYILNNIQYWRGPTAKRVRAEFKRLSQRKAWA